MMIDNVAYQRAGVPCHVVDIVKDVYYANQFGYFQVALGKSGSGNTLLVKMVVT